MKGIIPLMLKFYESIPQAKFSIMISLYRAFAEDSREKLSILKSKAYSTPYSFINNLKQELSWLEEVTDGMTKDHFYV